MPEQTLCAFADHGNVERAVETDLIETERISPSRTALASISIRPLRAPARTRRVALRLAPVAAPSTAPSPSFHVGRGPAL